MFDDRTYENILQEVLARAPSEIDVRQGSIFFDAVAGTCFQIAKYYADITNAFDLVFLTTAVDEFLDRKGEEHGVFRRQATPAQYEFLFDGSAPSEGDRFFADGLYFSVVVSGENNNLQLKAETSGSLHNYILEGTAAVPVHNIAGLSFAMFGKLLKRGEDAEPDDDYRNRIREKIGGPAENGNRQHYKTWCEGISGVGRARIIPLWNGDNTVKGVLVGSDGLPATDSVVQAVQEYVDPGGTGLGNGAANIGAFFTAAAAIKLDVHVSFHAVLNSSASVEQAKQEATEIITSYLKSMAIDTPDTEKIVIRVSTIGALLFSIPSLIDYSDLRLNGSASNIEVEDGQVAVLTEVTLDVDV